MTWNFVKNEVKMMVKRGRKSGEPGRVGPQVMVS